MEMKFLPAFSSKSYISSPIEMTILWVDKSFFTVFIVVKGLCKV